MKVLLKTPAFRAFTQRIRMAYTLRESIILNCFRDTNSIFSTKSIKTFCPTIYLSRARNLPKRTKNIFDNPVCFCIRIFAAYESFALRVATSDGKTCKNCAYKNGFTYVDRKNYEFKILRNKAANCYFTLYNSKIHDISSKVKPNSFNLYLNMLQLSRDEADNVFAAFKDNLSLTTRDKTNGHFINGVL